MSRVRAIAFISLLSLSLLARANREVISLNGPWKLLAQDDPTPGAESPSFADKGWKATVVPSAFNAEKSDWRNLSNTWYRRHFRLPALAYKRVYVTFEAVNAVAEVYVNGQDVGGHRGGYTAFTLDITKAAKAGDNVIAVHVDNKNFKDCLPAEQRLFKIYGGLIRNVRLTLVHPIHIDPTDHGSIGVFFTPTVVTPELGEAGVKVLVRNTGESKPVTVSAMLTSGPMAYPDCEDTKTVSAEPGRTEVGLHLKLKHPRLWSPEHPDCYRLNVTLIVDGKLADATYSIIVGFRKIERRGDSLYLNGNPILLRGFAKHEDTEASGGAITERELQYEYYRLKDVGANFVRMAHYPHTQFEVSLADRNGICVWAENGRISALPATDTGREITREMVKQLYNHPSIIFWSAGNEADRKTDTTNEYARVIHEEDKTRLVTYADNFNNAVSKFTELDVVSRNAYPGWYGGGDVAETLLRDHFVSENGWGASITTHTSYGETVHNVDKFEPEEYQCENLETVCATLFGPRANEVPMYAMWNFRDFADRKYKGLNTKGMLTFDGMPKDCYYLWKSFLRPEDPVVYIASKRYFIRPKPESQIKVYSNQPALRLTVNGEDMGVQRSGDYIHANGLVVPHVFLWNIRLQPGANTVRVTDGRGHNDSCVLTSTMPQIGNGLLDHVFTTAGQPAWFIDDAIRPDFGFYCNFDGTGDNMIATLPKELEGARWISTKRLSDPANKNDLGIMASRQHGVILYVITSADSEVIPSLIRGGFQLTRLKGTWRNNKINIGAYAVYSRSLGAGEQVAIPGATADYLILVKPGH